MVQGTTHLGIYEPEHLSSIRFGNTALDKELANLLGNTNRCGTSTKENQLLVLEGDARVLEGIDSTSKYDGTSSLNVVIEASVCIAISL